MNDHDHDHDGPRPDEPLGVEIEVSNLQAHLDIDPDAVARLVGATLTAEGVARASVSVALVDDATIQVLNRRHLGHDWPTDVISFVLSDPEDAVLSAELIVSVETAVATARREDLPAWDELALYLVHGSLHLCGHDDLDATARDVMRRREGELLAQLGLSHTFSAATEGERARWTL